jgi:mRNA-degrading endonuclease RelE of RelBE toxin-antitoxin system
MAFEIILAPDAARALRKLPGHLRAWVKDEIDRHLRHQPAQVSRSRIKRLRGRKQPHYRLRVGDIRVFYDITETQVEVLAIVTKTEAQDWLRRRETPAPDSGAG